MWTIALDTFARALRAADPRTAEAWDARQMIADRQHLDLDVEWEPRQPLNDRLAQIARRVVEFHFG